MSKGVYGIPGKVPDLTIGDGKIDNPQEVYDFLKDMPEYSKLVQVLSLLATKESLDEVVEELADKSAHDEARNLAAIMSLATDPNAGVTISTTNPEWKLVYTDAEDRILIGKRQDNTWYVATDLDTILDTIISGYESE